MVIVIEANKEEDWHWSVFIGRRKIGQMYLFPLYLTIFFAFLFKTLSFAGIFRIIIPDDS